jgi:hypothetical protein
MPARNVKEYQMLETMTLLEVVASLWLGIMVVVSAMAGVIKLDEYFYKRKRVRELDAQREVFMKNRRLDQAHHDLMMRTGMNPVFRHSALCTANRSNILTNLPRPEPVESPAWDGVPVEAQSLLVPHGIVRYNQATLDRIAEHAQTQLDNMARDHMTTIPAPDLFKIKEEVDSDRVDET